VNRLIRRQREALKLPTVADPLQSGTPHD
jgi:hypothetical protein